MELLKMDLRTYLFINRLSLKEFSEKINYSRNQVSEVMHGKRKPGRKLAKEIEKATNGEVTAQELLKDKGDKENGSKEVD